MRLALALVLFSTSLGCASTTEAIQRRYAPGQLQTGSHIHAYQAGAFAHAFMDGHMRQYEARLGRLQTDVPPLFTELDRAGWNADLAVKAHQNKNATAEYEYYDVDLVLTAKDPKIRDRFVIPGAQGTDPNAYEAALAPAAQRTGISADVIKRGHFALFGLVTLSSTLNATDDSMKRYAFGLLVLEERLKRGDRADYLAPLRPARESLEDVDVALAVVAEHHRAAAKLRAEVIALTALVRASGDPKVRTVLDEQVAESRKTASTWLATHQRPTMDQYGVALKKLELPTPENLLATLDKEGYVSAAVMVAKGIAAGDPAATVQALGKLAPEGSSLRIASEGTAAALRGDVAKVVDSAIALAEKQEDVAAITARLRAVERNVNAVRDTANNAVATARSLPTSKAAIEAKARGALEDAKPTR